MLRLTSGNFHDAKRLLGICSTVALNAPADGAGRLGYCRSGVFAAPGKLKVEVLTQSLL